MPSKPNPADLAIGGIATFQALHAVLDMADRLDGPIGELRGPFLALAESTRDTHNEAAQKGFRLGLLRLLFAAMQSLYLREQARVAQGFTDVGSVDALVDELLDGSTGEVARLVRLAQSTMSPADFLRATTYGAQTQARDEDICRAAALVLHALLQLDKGDPERRWIVLGSLTNALAAAHYLT